MVHKMDIITTFLNNDLEEEIYMKQPKGFVVHGQESKVSKLDTSLYGLNQCPRQWHELFKNMIILNGFKVNQSYKCMY